MDIYSGQSKENVGYLVIRASTARGAIPLADASVSIRQENADKSGILYSLRTNTDGLTPRVALPAPPRSQSQQAGATSPFSSWSIEVYKDGYLPLSFSGVPVYSGVVSVQPAVMVPIPEGFRPSQSFNETTAPEL